MPPRLPTYTLPAVADGWTLLELSESLMAAGVPSQIVYLWACEAARLSPEGLRAALDARRN